MPDGDMDQYMCLVKKKKILLRYCSGASVIDDEWL